AIERDGGPARPVEDVGELARRSPAPRSSDDAQALVVRRLAEAVELARRHLRARNAGARGPANEVGDLGADLPRVDDPDDVVRTAREDGEPRAQPLHHLLGAKVARLAGAATFNEALLAARRGHERCMMPWRRAGSATAEQSRTEDGWYRGGPVFPRAARRARNRAVRRRARASAVYTSPRCAFSTVSRRPALSSAPSSLPACLPCNWPGAGSGMGCSRPSRRGTRSRRSRSR